MPFPHVVCGTVYAIGVRRCTLRSVIGKWTHTSPKRIQAAGKHNKGTKKSFLIIAGLTIFTNPLISILFCLLNLSILFCFALLCFYFAFSFVHFVMCFCFDFTFFVSFVSFVYYCIVYLQQPLDNRTVTVSM